MYDWPSCRDIVRLSPNFPANGRRISKVGLIARSSKGFLVKPMTSRSAQEFKLTLQLPKAACRLGGR